MQNRLKRIFHFTTALAGATAALTILLPVGCSIRPDQTTTAGGGGATGAGGTNPASGPGAGPGAGPSTGPGAGPGAGGAVNPAAGAVTSGGGSIMQDDPTCSAFTAPRANVLAPVDPSVPQMLSSMTIDEKIALLSGGPVAAQNWTEDFAATGNQKLKIPNYEMRDGPRGVHLRMGDNASQSTTFAVAEARAASFDVGLEYRVGKAQGEEMRAFKYELSLAPVVNVLRHPQWGRAQETYGEDPVLVGEMGAVFVAGLQLNAGACPKHYTGNDTEDNRNATTATIDEQTLRENYARPFEIIVKKADPACIMAAYNGVNSDQTCTVNHHLLTDILRTDWGWTGFVVSDWWATKGDGATNLNAGLDLEMSDNQAFKSLSAANSTRVDESATRILNARVKMKGLDPAFISSSPNPSIVNNADHVALAQETEEKGAVLLRNEGILPLGAAATTAGMGTANVTSIVILGPDAKLPDGSLVGTSTTQMTADIATGLGDQGSSYTVPPHTVSFLKGLQTRAGASVSVTTATDPNSAAVKNASVVIIPVAMSHSDEGEGYNNGQDRVDMTLSGTHPRHWGSTKPAALIKQAAATNPNVVVLLAVGGAVLVEDWMNSAKAIIQTFYTGEEGGTAVARLLYGDVNFSGKLPFTVAQNAADYPAFQNTGPTSTYDYFHGYRKFEHDNKAPRYWFGYGMSYTTYEYSDAKVLCTNGITTTGRLNVEVTVKNSGKMAGEEAVQVYIGYPNTKVKRPAKELKAFGRVALMPGESKTVQFQIPAADMAYWDTASSKWVVEKVGHTVLVGPSADPTKLTAVPFTID